MKIIYIIFVVFLLSPLISQAEEQYVIKDIFIYSTSKLLNKDKICFLRFGATVSLRGNFEETLAVQYSNKNVRCYGFVEKHLLSKERIGYSNDELMVPTYYTKCQTNIYINSSIASKQIAKFTKYGVGVTISQEESGFSLIQWQSKTATIRGWCESKHLVSLEEYSSIKASLKARYLKKHARELSDNEAKLKVLDKMKGKKTITIDEIIKNAIRIYKKDRLGTAYDYIKDLGKQNLLVSGSGKIHFRPRPSKKVSDSFTVYKKKGEADISIYGRGYFSINKKTFSKRSQKDGKFIGKLKSVEISFVRGQIYTVKRLKIEIKEFYSVEGFKNSK